jgi:hypothetical protein
MLAVGGPLLIQHDWTEYFASAFGVALPNAYAFPRIKLSTTVARFH